MTIRDTDDARIANLRACLASVSAKAEQAIGDKWVTPLTGKAHVAQAHPLTVLQMIHDACEAALKADERAGGKR